VDVTPIEKESIARANPLLKWPKYELPDRIHVRMEKLP
jgi:hypothetical protein